MTTTKSNVDAGADQDALDEKLDSLYQFVSGDEDARVCKDIPDAACSEQPRNFLAWLSANTLSKLADEVASARLVLPWLFSALGAPAAMAGFLVPIREAGVLLPQLVVAAWIRKMQRRKWAWIGGALLSALSLMMMAWAALTLEGAQAGWALLGALIVFSLSRGICSVSAKDVLGKTVSKTRRGNLMGRATAISGALTVVLGLVISTDWFAPSVSLYAGMLVVAAGLWLCSASLFAGIVEVPGSTEDGGNAISTALKSLTLLKSDPDFRRFVIARSLLLSVALAAPFYVLLAQQQGSAGGFGLMVLASGLASALSATFWGRWSDRSSLRVMQVTAAGSGVLGLLTWFLSSQWQQGWIYALLFFLSALLHAGARLGRKAYLVDMADSETRASYVAVSNTVIGIVMLLAGSVGIIADIWTNATVLGVLAIASLLAVPYMQSMKDVSG